MTPLVALRTARPRAPRHRVQKHPVVAATAAFHFALCLVLAEKEWDTNGKLCSWCQVATAISGVTAALTLPEAVEAAKGLAD